MKKNLEFYQHFTDADQHPKFKMLRVKFGWEGEGKFWALNNRIGLAKYGWLNLSKKFNRASIATDLDFNMEEFENFISYLEKDCELIFWDEKTECISTDTIQENIVKVMGDRKASRDRKRRQKVDENDISDGKGKSSPELSKSSTDQNNKPNQTKPNQNKLNQIYNQDSIVIFTEIKKILPIVDGFFKKRGQIFDSRKWAVQQFRNKGHPGAILETFKSMINAKFEIDNPNGIANHIFKRENGNFNEKDFIKMQEEWKNMKPGELSKLTDGLFQEI